ncbi:hypothetical protein BH10CHL1_BH10CHL1_27720 [soil metagenome]
MINRISSIEIFTEVVGVILPYFRFYCQIVRRKIYFDYNLLHKYYPLFLKARMIGIAGGLSGRGVNVVSSSVPSL